MAGPDDAPTQKDVQRIASSVEDIHRKLDALPDRIADKYVSKETFNGAQDLHKAKHESQDEKIASLLSTNQWIVRLVGSVIIVALLGLVLISR